MMRDEESKAVLSSGRVSGHALLLVGTFLACLLLPIGRATAQVPILDDPNLAAGVAVVENPAAPVPSGSGPMLCLKKPGAERATAIGASAPPRSGGAPIAWDLLFHEAGALVPIQVDALSVGLDVIDVVENPTTGTAEVRLPGPPEEQWRGLLFTMGGSDADPMRRADIVDLEPRYDNDVFDALYAGGTLPMDYVVDDPNRPGPMGNDLLRKVVDGDDSGIGTVSAIAALDAHLPAYFLDDDVLAELPENPRVYFSVTNATAASVPAAWARDAAGAPVLVDGATVFVREWTGAGWATPTVALTGTDIGLPQGEDIDALAVRYDYGGGQATMSTKLFFSTVVTPASPTTVEVWYFDAGSPAFMGGTPKPVTDANGEVAGPMKIVVSRSVESLCDFDPIRTPLQSGCKPSGFLWNFVFGTPRDVGFPLGRTFFGSVQRTCIGPDAGFVSTVDGFFADASGMPVGRPTRWLHLWMLGTDTSPGTVIGATVDIDRPPLNSATLRIPAPFRALDRATCTHLWSVWVGLDRRNIGRSFPMRIAL